jgi:hypothetical protein
MGRVGLQEGLPLLCSIANGTFRRLGQCPTCGEVTLQAQPTAKEITAANAELRQLGVGSKIDVETPNTPVVFGFLVAPELAQEQGE